MDLFTDIASWFFLVSGSLFIIIGAFGIIRLPDVFCRMHASGIIDTAGAGFILIGLMFQAGVTLIAIKLALVVVFLVFTSPTATHALAGAAEHGLGKPAPDLTPRPKKNTKEPDPSKT